MTDDGRWQIKNRPKLLKNSELRKGKRTYIGSRVSGISSGTVFAARQVVF